MKFAKDQRVRYDRPKIGWVNATVVAQTSKDLVIRVDGNTMDTKIALRHIRGNDSPIKL